MVETKKVVELLEPPSQEPMAGLKKLLDGFCNPGNIEDDDDDKSAASQPSDQNGAGENENTRGVKNNSTTEKEDTAFSYGLNGSSSCVVRCFRQKDSVATSDTRSVSTPPKAAPKKPQHSYRLHCGVGLVAIVVGVIFAYALKAICFHTDFAGTGSKQEVPSVPEPIVLSPTMLLSQVHTIQPAFDSSIPEAAAPEEETEEEGKAWDLPLQKLQDQEEEIKTTSDK